MKEMKGGILMVDLLRNFFGGAAVGSVIAFMCSFWQNIATIKKENKIPIDQILMRVIIGFLMGGAIAAACFK